MRYISTRGQAPALGFEDVVLTGLASDGGLYVPETLPQFSTEELTAMAGESYAEIAFRVKPRHRRDHRPCGGLERRRHPRRRSRRL